MYKRSKEEVERIVNSLKGPVPPPPESMLDRMRNEYNAQMSPQYANQVKLEKEQERQRMEQEEREFNANWDRQRREHLIGLPPSPPPPRRERDLTTGRRWSAFSPQKTVRGGAFIHENVEHRGRGDIHRKHMKHVSRHLELHGGYSIGRELMNPNSIESKIISNVLPAPVGKILTATQYLAPAISNLLFPKPETMEETYKRETEAYNNSERGKYYNALEAEKKARDAENALILERMRKRDLPPNYVAPIRQEQQQSNPGIQVNPRSTDKYVSCDTRQGHMKLRGTCVDRSGREVEGFSYAGGSRYY